MAQDSMCLYCCSRGMFLSKCHVWGLKGLGSRLQGLEGLSNNLNNLGVSSEREGERQTEQDVGWFEAFGSSTHPLIRNRVLKAGSVRQDFPESVCIIRGYLIKGGSD